jgi:hypothetical protein
MQLYDGNLNRVGFSPLPLTVSVEIVPRASFSLNLSAIRRFWFPMPATLSIGPADVLPPGQLSPFYWAISKRFQTSMTRNAYKGGTDEIEEKQERVIMDGRCLLGLVTIRRPDVGGG